MRFAYFCSQAFSRSGVTRGLSQGGKLCRWGPIGHRMGMQ